MTKIKLRLILNPYHETKKIKTWQMINKNSIRFYYQKKKNKNIIRLWKKNEPKIGVEHIKGSEKFYLYLYLLGT